MPKSRWFNPGFNLEQVMTRERNVGGILFQQDKKALS
jgi:hypothetical protein